MLFAIHACVNGPSSSLAVPLFFKKKEEHVGVRARANAPACGAALAHWPLLDSNRMGAHTAALVEYLYHFQYYYYYYYLHQPRRVSKCLCVRGVVCLFGSLLS